MPSRFLRMPGGDVYRYSPQLAAGLNVQEISDKEALDYFVAAGGYDLKALGFSDDELAAARAGQPKARTADKARTRGRGRGRAAAPEPAPEQEPDFEPGGEDDGAFAIMDEPDIE